MAVEQVPKFGNWDEKGIAYTNYFENVRKDRVVGFNPNDPEENPKAFILKQPIQEQHPVEHVPKFGNWDDKEIAYTNYFENERKDRVVGFNPNDPEENPEAFILKQPIQGQHPVKDNNILSQKSIIDPSTKSYNDSYHSCSRAAQIKAVSASSTEPIESSNVDLFSQNKKDNKRIISKRFCCFFKEPRE